MKRIPLNPGEKIYCNDREYIFDSLIGSGATCMVYSGHYIDDLGLQHSTRFKECYPHNADINRNGNEIIWTSNVEKEKSFADFSNSYEKLMKYQIGNFGVNVFDLVEANGTMYIIMDSNEGMTFDKAEYTTLHDVLYTVRLLAYVVGEYHNKGFLHLDIKPENFLVYPHPSEHILLFDLDSITAIDDIKKRKINTISYSAQWVAPEQIQKRLSKICPATDIFSIGAVLFYKVMGRNITSEDMGVFSDWEFENPLFKCVNPKAVVYLKKIFKKTLSANVDRRYGNVGEMIEDIDKAIEYSRYNCPYIVSNLPDAKSVFVGRQNELSQLDSLIGKNRVLFLSGIGGIGKTSIALEYLNKRKKDYGTILFLKYNTDIDKMLKLSGITFRNYNIDDTDMISALSDLMGEKDIIVIDNFDEIDKINGLIDFVDNSGIKCKFIITTRISLSALTDMCLTALKISEMHLAEISKLFFMHNEINYSNDEKSAIGMIINEVERHTLCVELIAKYIRIKAISPTEFYKKLCSSVHGIADFDDIKVVKNMNNQIQRESVQKHIGMLFDIMGLTNRQKEIIYSLSLLGAFYVSKKLFLKWVSFENKEEILESLIESGWVECTNENKISLHKLISDTSLSKFGRINFENMEVVSGLGRYIKNFSELNSYQQFAFSDLISSFFERLPAEFYSSKLQDLLIDYLSIIEGDISDKKIKDVLESLKANESEDFAVLAILCVFKVYHLCTYVIENSINGIADWNYTILLEIRETMLCAIKYSEHSSPDNNLVLKCKVVNKLANKISNLSFYSEVKDTLLPEMIKQSDECAEEAINSTIDTEDKLNICKCFFMLVQMLSQTESISHIFQRIRMFADFCRKAERETDDIKNEIRSAVYHLSSLSDDYKFKADCLDFLTDKSEEESEQKNFYLAMCYIQKKQPEKAVELWNECGATEIIECISYAIEQDCFDRMKSEAMDFLVSLTQHGIEENDPNALCLSVRACSVIFNFADENEKAEIQSKIKECYYALFRISTKNTIDDFYVQNLFGCMLDCYEATGTKEYEKLAFSWFEKNKTAFDDYYGGEYILDYAIEKFEKKDFVISSYLFACSQRVCLPGYHDDNPCFLQIEKKKRMEVLNILFKMMDLELPQDQKAEIADNKVKTICCIIWHADDTNMEFYTSVTDEEKTMVVNILAKVDALLTCFDEESLNTYYIAKLYDALSLIYDYSSDKCMRYKARCNYGMIAETECMKLKDIDEISYKWEIAANGYRDCDKYAEAYDCYKKEREFLNNAEQKDIYKLHLITRECIRILYDMSDEKAIDREISIYISEVKEWLMSDCKGTIYEDDIISDIEYLVDELLEGKMYAVAERLSVIQGILLIDIKEYLHIEESTTEELHEKLIVKMSDYKTMRQIATIDEFLRWCDNYVKNSLYYNTGNEQIKKLCFLVLSDLSSNHFASK